MYFANRLSEQGKKDCSLFHGHLRLDPSFH